MELVQVDAASSRSSGWKYAAAANTLEGSGGVVAVVNCWMATAAAAAAVVLAVAAAVLVIAILVLVVAAAAVASPIRGNSQIDGQVELAQRLAPLQVLNPETASYST